MSLTSWYDEQRNLCWVTDVLLVIHRRGDKGSLLPRHDADVILCLKFSITTQAWKTGGKEGIVKNKTTDPNSCKPRMITLALPENDILISTPTDPLPFHKRKQCFNNPLFCQVRPDDLCVVLEAQSSLSLESGCGSEKLHANPFSWTVWAHTQGKNQPRQGRGQLLMARGTKWTAINPVQVGDTES